MRWIVIAALLAGACKKEEPAKPAAAPVAPTPAGDKPPPDNAPKVPEPSADRDAAFWTWFKDHRLEIAKIKRADEPIANQIASEMHKVDPRLIFELGIGIEPKEFIVSADGHREVFNAVKRLVAAAPEVPGWKIIAFRPRKSADLTIELGEGTKLGAGDLYYVMLPTSKPPAPVDIIVYIPGLGGGDKDKDDALKQVGFLLLDATLGEYDTETRLGGIAFKSTAEKPASAKPLRDLPKLIDAGK
jgi:hypothetical protein